MLIGPTRHPFPCVTELCHSQIYDYKYSVYNVLLPPIHHRRNRYYPSPCIQGFSLYFGIMCVIDAVRDASDQLSDECIAGKSLVRDRRPSEEEASINRQSREMITP